MKQRVSAIILAAGRSRRFGPPKQLATVEGKTLLERAVGVVKEAAVDEIVVVLGHRAEEVRRKVDLTGVTVAVNKGYAKGISSSLRVGLDSIGPGAGGVLIVLGDQPYLDSEAIDRVIATYRETGKRIVIPVHGRVQGNPVLFDSAFFDELRSLAGDTGAKEVIARHQSDVGAVALGSRRYLEDVDTQADLRRARRRALTKGATRTRAAGRPRRAPLS